MTVLRQRLCDDLGPTQCSVWLFGSLARGDWDGFSGTSLLVVAASREEAERTAEWQGGGHTSRASDIRFEIINQAIT
jgi:predicted nucleotidyltransferase